MTMSSPASPPRIGITSSFCRHPLEIPMTALAQRYIAAVRAAGGMPFIIPFDTPPTHIPALLETCDGLLFSGGGDIDPACYRGQEHPKVYDVNHARDALEISLAQEAVSQGIPFLGICRGIQVINVALGGSLYEDLPSQYPNALAHRRDPKTERTLLAHTVRIAPQTRLHHVLEADELQVNSLHHQGVREVAPSLTAVAWSPDGLVEAVEAPNHPFGVAVQWHPEWLYDEHPAQLSLFQALVQAAAQRG
ncbi:MAG: gamma-glutamyl-gamma-aminobutyrate hydrolase family protein [Chloroflexi bacterium]|nr:gamma-glutamyl-gamma-aminobutyrate hydrolase family protein [Chloroflexota bacterium]